MPGSRSFALAFLLLSLAVIACKGESAIEGVTVPSTQTPEPSLTETQSASNVSSPTREATPIPTVSPTVRAVVSTPTPNADGVYVVECGDFFVPLDKLHRLEDDCVPDALVPIPELYAYGPQEVNEVVLLDLLALLEAALAEGHHLAVVSSYRSFETQRNTFQYHVDTLGLEQASAVSARPGHSEHQLGTTIDFSSATVGFELVELFGRTPEGRWLAEHAYEFGFVLSYPEGLTAVTGYVYEPWHFRWVGREMAGQVRTSELTLGQFLLR